MINLEKVKKFLENMPQIEFAYLFGSYAKNSYDAQSDVDVAIYVREDCNIFDTKLEVHHKLEIMLNKQIDLVVLNSAKNFFLLEDILRDHIILKDALEDKRVMFELDKEHQILDYKAFKRMFDVA